MKPIKVESGTPETDITIFPSVTDSCIVFRSEHLLIKLWPYQCLEIGKLLIKWADGSPINYITRNSMEIIICVSLNIDTVRFIAQDLMHDNIGSCYILFDIPINDAVRIGSYLLYHYSKVNV